MRPCVCKFHIKFPSAISSIRRQTDVSSAARRPAATESDDQLHRPRRPRSGRRLSLQVLQLGVVGRREGWAGAAVPLLRPPELARLRRVLDARCRLLPSTQTLQQHARRQWPRQSPRMFETYFIRALKNSGFNYYLPVKLYAQLRVIISKTVWTPSDYPKFDAQVQASHARRRSRRPVRCADEQLRHVHVSRDAVRRRHRLPERTRHPAEDRPQPVREGLSRQRNRKKVWPGPTRRVLSKF